MAEYRIIADISITILKILKNNLVPDVISKNDAIGLCVPGEKNDYKLGVYLYNIKESDHLKINTVIDNGTNSLQYPPKFVDLYYMITPYSSADVKYRIQENYLIAGKVIQAIEDNSIINISENEYSEISLIQASNDEKSYLWNAAGMPYQLSLFYKVSPVCIDSEKTKNISRVVSRDFSFIQHNEEG